MREPLHAITSSSIAGTAGGHWFAMHPIQFGPALYTAVTVREKIYILRQYVVITNIIIVNLPFPWGKMWIRSVRILSVTATGKGVWKCHSIAVSEISEHHRTISLVHLEGFFSNHNNYFFCGLKVNHKNIVNEKSAPFTFLYWIRSINIYIKPSIFLWFKNGEVVGRFGLNSSHTYRHRSAAPRVSIEITYNGPLTRYVKLRVAHAPGMPGMFSPPPTSKETASKRSRRASLTHSGGENVSGIPGACATRNFTYLARGPFLALARLLYIDGRLRHFTNILCHLKQKC